MCSCGRKLVHPIGEQDTPYIEGGLCVSLHSLSSICSAGGRRSVDLHLLNPEGDACIYSGVFCFAHSFRFIRLHLPRDGLQAYNLCYSTLVAGEDKDKLKPDQYLTSPTGDMFVKSEVGFVEDSHPRFVAGLPFWPQIELASRTHKVYKQATEVRPCLIAHVGCVYHRSPKVCSRRFWTSF